jgi:hypothetical protein
MTGIENMAVGRSEFCFPVLNIMKIIPQMLNDLIVSFLIFEVILLKTVYWVVRW